MKIEVTFDVSAYASEVDVFVERSFAPAIVDALNVAGERARLAVVEAMSAAFDRPTPFTTGGVGLFSASLDNAPGKEPAAYLRIQPDRAAYLQYQILGGTRGPGDPGSTSLGPLVPGPDAQLDAYGNLPQDYVEDELANGAAWVQLQEGQPPALIREVAGRMEILALIVHELHYDAPRLPFYDIVTSAVTSAFPAAFDAALSGRLG